jgi:hypothetical protein
VALPYAWLCVNLRVHRPPIHASYMSAQIVKTEVDGWLSSQSPGEAALIAAKV